MKQQKQVAKVLRQIKKHLPQGAKILIACSGGADSVALTDALLCLREEQQYKLSVCHVEHGLRGAEALADADFVEAFCRYRQVDCEIIRVEAKKLALESKLSVEDAARKLRYKALFDCVGKQQADYLVTAHHRDDQAETLMLHLLRGSGIDGLSGMREEKNFLVRPFLTISRQELEIYCQLRDLSYRNDSSNEDIYFTRNKVRHVLLPLLEDEFNPEIKKSLSNTANLLSEDANYLSLVAEKYFSKHVQMCDGGYSVSATDLLAEHVAVKSRIIRTMWKRLNAEGLFSYEHTKQIILLLKRGSSNKKIALPGATCAVYNYGELKILKTLVQNSKEDKIDNVEKQSISLDAVRDSRTVHLQMTDKILELAYVESQEKPLAQVAYPWHLLNGNKIELRIWQDGDRFFPEGSIGTKKLKKYFNEEKINVDDRKKQLLVACGQQVLWLLGGKAAGWHEQECKAWLTLTLKASDGGTE